MFLTILTCNRSLVCIDLSMSVCLSGCNAPLTLIRLSCVSVCLVVLALVPWDVHRCFSLHSALDVYPSGGVHPVLMPSCPFEGACASGLSCVCSYLLYGPIRQAPAAAVRFPALGRVPTRTGSVREDCFQLGIAWKSFWPAGSVAWQVLHQRSWMLCRFALRGREGDSGWRRGRHQCRGAGSVFECRSCCCRVSVASGANVDSHRPPTNNVL